MSAPSFSLFSSQPDSSLQSQVYVQVQVLFKDAPDLLAEFKDFLPEITGGIPHPGNAIMPPPSGAGPSSQPWNNSNDSAPVSPEKVSKKPVAPGVKRKKRVIEKEPTPAPPSKPAPSRVCDHIDIPTWFNYFLSPGQKTQNCSQRRSRISFVLPFSIAKITAASHITLSAFITSYPTLSSPIYTFVCPSTSYPHHSK